MNDNYSNSSNGRVATPAKDKDCFSCTCMIRHGTYVTALVFGVGTSLDLWIGSGFEARNPCVAGRTWHNGLTRLC